jgi:hypothetical protein
MFQGASPCHADELMYLGPEESFTFAPPTTTCCLSRLPAASHDYLLPPKTTCRLPRLLLNLCGRPGARPNKAS